MKSWMSRLLALSLVLLVGACSDDDDGPTDVNPPGGDTESTVWVEDGGYWRSVVDASGYDEFAGYSFIDKDVVSMKSAPASAWDIAFRREVVKLNGGSSGDGGFEGADLGVVEFAVVSAADAAGADWTSDTIEHMFDDWYVYDPVRHELELTNYVYSMKDATGEHYVKFRVDSLSGDVGMGSMGTVHLSYFYQSEENNRDLSGEISTAQIEVGTGTGFFDFSTGSQITPVDPMQSLEWDISFHDYDLAMNSGPNGSGSCAGFPAYGELNDPTDIEEFTEQPVGAPLFPDIPGSVLTDWYDYNGQTHQLSSKNRVYLLRSGDRLYKMKILSYYGDQGGSPISAVYTFIWNELD